MSTAIFTSSRTTLRNERRDFHEWHLGRPHFVLWALALDAPALNRRLKAAQTHLSDLLLRDYRRQAHITLALCGFPSHQPSRDDDFGPDLLETHFLALKRSALKPFEIEIGGLASFTSAPYLTVNDPQQSIDTLRSKLATSPLNRPREPYTAHVTVGLYADAWPTRDVQHRLDGFSTDSPLRLAISHVHLLSYAAHDVGGPLSSIATYDLESNEVLKSAHYPFHT